MPTSSIRKQFIAKDLESFERILKEAEEAPVREITVSSPSLEEGRKALKQFSFCEKTSHNNIIRGY